MKQLRAFLAVAFVLPCGAGLPAAFAEVYSFTTINGVADDAATIAARDARFATLSGVAVDSAGNIYVADAGAHVIRKISPGGVATRLAGQTGVAGSADGTGSAKLSRLGRVSPRSRLTRVGVGAGPRLPTESLRGPAGELLPALDDDVAVERVDLDQVRSAAVLLRGD